MWLWRILRNLAAIYVLFTGLVYLFQRRLQYFPDASAVPAPEGERYSGLTTVELKTGDGLRLLSWYWPGNLPITLVVFHGNAGHRGHRLEWLEDLHNQGYGVFILDYRGYGDGEGSPTENGLYLDAEAALRWLKDGAGNKMVYLGESLGCGVAVEMALRFPPSALILQSGFSSALDVARNTYPLLPVGWLMKDRYLSSEKIRRVRCPVLVIHGEKDSIIPLRFGRDLYEKANEPKEWFTVPGADHNDLPWLGGKDYLKRINSFLRLHLDR